MLYSVLGSKYGGQVVTIPRPLFFVLQAKDDESPFPVPLKLDVTLESLIGLLPNILAGYLLAKEICRVSLFVAVSFTYFFVSLCSSAVRFKCLCSIQRATFSKDVICLLWYKGHARAKLMWAPPYGILCGYQVI